MDIGATIHISNSLWELKNLRKPNEAKLIIKLWNGDKVHVEQIGAISLVLSSSHVLNLKDVVYVLSMRRNLILVVSLDHNGYYYNFGSGKL